MRLFSEEETRQQASTFAEIVKLEAGVQVIERGAANLLASRFEIQSLIMTCQQDLFQSIFSSWKAANSGVGKRCLREISPFLQRRQRLKENRETT